MYREHTFSERAQLTLHRSLFRERLLALPGGRPLVDWRVEEANVRGHFGVTGPPIPDRKPSDGLSDEQLIAALLMPHGVLDVRLFDARRLLRRAATREST